MKIHNAEVHTSVHTDGRLCLDIRDKVSQTIYAHILLNESGVIALRAALTRYLKTGSPLKTKKD